MFSLKNNICVWSSIDCRFFKCVNQSSAISVFSFDTNFFNQSFSVRSRLWNDRHAAKCVLPLLLFKMNATRDWNRKGSSCGGVLGRLSQEVLVQRCLSPGLRPGHTSNLFLTIAITWHLLKVIKYHWKARDQRSKSVLRVPPPDTTQNSPRSIIHHLQSCHFLWFFYSLCQRISGSTPFLLARQSQRFLKTS